MKDNTKRKHKEVQLVVNMLIEVYQYNVVEQFIERHYFVSGGTLTGIIKKDLSGFPLESPSLVYTAVVEDTKRKKKEKNLIKKKERIEPYLFKI